MMNKSTVQYDWIVSNQAAQFISMIFSMCAGLQETDQSGWTGTRSSRFEKKNLKNVIMFN